MLHAKITQIWYLLITISKNCAPFTTRKAMLVWYLYVSVFQARKWQQVKFITSTIWCFMFVFWVLTLRKTEALYIYFFRLTTHVGDHELKENNVLLACFAHYNYKLMIIYIITNHYKVPMCSCESVWCIYCTYVSVYSRTLCMCYYIAFTVAYLPLRIVLLSVCLRRSLYLY